MGKKIKCFSNVKCEKCHVKGMLQIFLNSYGKIRYSRVRHYNGMIDGKPKFHYCKQSIKYVKKILDDLNNDQSKENVDRNLKGLNSKSQNRSGRSLAWSRTSASQAGDPGSNPGDRTTK